jgi:hypothetical protein
MLFYRGGWSARNDFSRAMPVSQKVKVRGNDTTKVAVWASRTPPAYIKPIGKIAMAIAQNTRCQRAGSWDAPSSVEAVAASV